MDAQLLVLTLEMGKWPGNAEITFEVGPAGLEWVECFDCTPGAAVDFSAAVAWAKPDA